MQNPHMRTFVYVYKYAYYNSNPTHACRFYKLINNESVVEIIR